MLGQALRRISRGYKKDCVDVRQGNTIEKDGKLFQILKFEHTRGMARQSGNVQLELRELIKGGKGNKSTLRMKPGHTLEVVRLEERNYQVLYLDGKTLQVMDSRTYDQLELPLELFETSIQQKLVTECTYMEEPPEVTVIATNPLVWVHPAFRALWTKPTDSLSLALALLCSLSNVNVFETGLVVRGRYAILQVAADTGVCCAQGF